MNVQSEDGKVMWEDRSPGNEYRLPGERFARPDTPRRDRTRVENIGKASSGIGNSDQN